MENEFRSCGRLKLGGWRQAVPKSVPVPVCGCKSGQCKDHCKCKKDQPKGVPHYVVVKENLSDSPEINYRVDIL